MKKLNRKKYKQQLTQSLKLLSVGERHKTWECPIFEKLPVEWVVTESIDPNNLVTYAGDIAQNFLEFYKIHSIVSEKKIIECTSVKEKHKIVSFYMDAVAIVPKEILPHVKSEETLIDLEKEKRKSKLLDKKSKGDKLKSLKGNSHA